MEGLIVLGLILFCGWIFKAVIAGGKSIVTGDSFQESMQGFPNWQIRCTKSNNEKLKSLDLYDIEIKGLLPIAVNTNLAIVTSILDVTDEAKPKPVISFIDKYQELESPVFQNYVSLGNGQPNTGYTKWVRAGSVFMKLLQPPKSGIEI